MSSGIIQQGPNGTYWVKQDNGDWREFNAQGQWTGATNSYGIMHYTSGRGGYEDLTGGKGATAPSTQILHPGDPGWMQSKDISQQGTELAAAKNPGNVASTLYNGRPGYYSLGYTPFASRETTSVASHEIKLGDSMQSLSPSAINPMTGNVYGSGPVPAAQLEFLKPSQIAYDYKLERLGQAERAVERTKGIPLLSDWAAQNYANIRQATPEQLYNQQMVSTQHLQIATQGLLLFGGLAAAGEASGSLPKTTFARVEIPKPPLATLSSGEASFNIGQIGEAAKEIYGVPAANPPKRIVGKVVFTSDITSAGQEASASSSAMKVFRTQAPRGLHTEKAEAADVLGRVSQQTKLFTEEGTQNIQTIGQGRLVSAAPSQVSPAEVAGVTGYARPESQAVAQKMVNKFTAPEGFRIGIKSSVGPVAFETPSSLLSGKTPGSQNILITSSSGKFSQILNPPQPVPEAFGLQIPRGEAIKVITGQGSEAISGTAQTKYTMKFPDVTEGIARASRSAGADWLASQFEGKPLPSGKKTPLSFPETPKAPETQTYNVLASQHLSPSDLASMKGGTQARVVPAEEIITAKPIYDIRLYDKPISWNEAVYSNPVKPVAPTIEVPAIRPPTFPQATAFMQPKFAEAVKPNFAQTTYQFQGVSSKILFFQTQQQIGLLQGQPQMQFTGVLQKQGIGQPPAQGTLQAFNYKQISFPTFPTVPQPPDIPSTPNPQSGGSPGNPPFWTAGIPFPSYPFGGSSPSLRPPGRTRNKPIFYLPSLIGRFSGRTITRAPKVLTGLEVRFPIFSKRRKK